MRFVNKTTLDADAAGPVADREADCGPATGPLAAWLGIQLAAVAVAAGRVPLAAKYPRPEELASPHVLLVTQLAASALLFPWLLRDWRTAIAVIASAWPFAAITSVLSALPPTRVFAGEIYVSVWITGLALWRALLRSQRSQMYAVALATHLTLGAAALSYFRMEFNPSPLSVGGSGGTMWRFIPVSGALGQLAAERASGWVWIFPASVALIPLTALCRRRLRPRARLSTSSAPLSSNSGPITS